MIICGNCKKPFFFKFNVDHVLKEGLPYYPQKACNCTTGVAVIVRTPPLCGEQEPDK